MSTDSHAVIINNFGRVTRSDRTPLVAGLGRYIATSARDAEITFRQALELRKGQAANDFTAVLDPKASVGPKLWLFGETLKGASELSLANSHFDFDVRLSWAASRVGPTFDGPSVREHGGAVIASILNEFTEASPANARILAGCIRTSGPNGEMNIAWLDALLEHQPFKALVRELSAGWESGGDTPGPRELDRELEIMPKGLALALALGYRPSKVPPRHGQWWEHCDLSRTADSVRREDRQRRAELAAATLRETGPRQFRGHEISGFGSGHAFGGGSGGGPVLGM